MSLFSALFIGIVALDCLIMGIVGKRVKDRDKAAAIKKWTLLLSGYAALATIDAISLALIALVTLLAWYCAKDKRRVRAGIAGAVAILCFFKYAVYIGKLFGNETGWLKIALPTGMSFYVFSAISYMVDVSRGKTKAESLPNVAAYLAFLPKLVSGPIQRSEDFFAQLKQETNITWRGISEGTQIFFIGVFKKLVLADHLAVFVDQVYATPDAFGSLTVLEAVFAYSFQIYFDFSGYSDMAIGAARVLGIDLPANFDLPYLAQNVTEFWKRWHISLSTWLQEYLYIPLGGNRKGKARAYLNLMITMLLGGMWHGTDVTYILWGALHGVGLILHKAWKAVTGSAGKKNSAAGRIASTIATFVFVSFCWIFFRAENMENAIRVIRRIVMCEAGLEQPYTWFLFAVIVWCVMASAAWIRSKKTGIASRKQNMCRVTGYYPLQDTGKFWQLVLLLVFIGMTLCLAYTGGSPFIYGKY